jgi:hypothetical protein
VDSKNKEANTIVALPGEVSLTMIFPKHVSIGLGIGKMESLEYRFDDNRLIIQSPVMLLVHRKLTRRKTSNLNDDDNTKEVGSVKKQEQLEKEVFAK